VPIIQECQDPDCRILTIGAFCISHEQPAKTHSPQTQSRRAAGSATFVSSTGSSTVTRPMSAIDVRM
jgi:hypothetical protein